MRDALCTAVSLVIPLLFYYARLLSAMMRRCHYHTLLLGIYRGMRESCFVACRDEPPERIRYALVITRYHYYYATLPC